MATVMAPQPRQQQQQPKQQKQQEYSIEEEQAGTKRQARTSTAEKVLDRARAVQRGEPAQLLAAKAEDANRLKTFGEKLEILRMVRFAWCKPGTREAASS